MKSAVSRGLEALAALLVSVVLGAVFTIVLQPLWSWIEATTGLESIGHSGPAGWCYLATSGVLFVGWAIVRARRAQRR
jgi:hypothetical protein